MSMSKQELVDSVEAYKHGAEWGRTFRVLFRVSRLSVHSDGLFVLPMEINQAGVLQIPFPRLIL